MNGTYDLALVIASYGVAVFASYTALDLGGRIALFDGARERLWLLTGALAMGTGIWSMHFVGMRAFRLPVEITFDLWLTLLSWVAAIGVSVLALYTISRSHLTAWGIGAGAAVMGIGICIMHYSGMWAMRMKPGIDYDPLLVSASALIAVVASAAALFICFSVRHLPDGRIVQAKVAAALIMGAAICGMHYTGMAAAHFAEGALCYAGNLLSGGWMGLPIALVTVGMLVAVTLLSMMDLRAVSERQRIALLRAETERVRRLAYYDTVTELPNRSLFNETLLKQLINVNGRVPPPFGVVYAELRGYRGLLETLGQERLNPMFRTLVGQLSPLLREGDMLARLSHDSFVFLLRDHEDRSIEAAMTQVAAQLAAPLLSGGETLRLNWGLGFSRFPESGNSTQQLIRAAMKLQRETGGAMKAAMEQTIDSGQGLAALPTNGP
jgi:diguanylate cyclase